jgi:hypothetical protein
MQVDEQTEQLCGLALMAGREELCPGAECPLWDDGSCALEHLTADGELSVDTWANDPA